MSDQNKKMDFYNGKGSALDVNYEKETARLFGNRKVGLLLALGLAFLMDVFVAVALVLTTKKVTFFIAPVLLAVLDLFFFADVFFINLNQKYTIGHRAIFIILSAALIAVTAVLPTANDAHRIMTLVALILFIAMQAIKILLTLLLYRIDKKSAFSAKDRFSSVVLILLLTVTLSAYAFWNYKVGFMGQYVTFGDENCTLVYRLTENDEYVVAGSFRDGNVISVPQTFNGKKVTAIDCSFLDSSIKKIKVAGDDLLFEKTEEVKEISETLVVETVKANTDAIRLGLFRECWTQTGEPTMAKEFFDRVVPVDLERNETYYNVSCTDEFTSKTVGYIPTIYKKDGANITLNDLKDKIDPQRKQLLERTDVTDQGDLKYCFENNNGMILTKGDQEKNDFHLTLEKVYKFTMGTGTYSYHGNDEKWNPSEREREMYSVAVHLGEYFEHLPTREGFSVNWTATPTGGEPYAITSDASFRDFVLQEGSAGFDLKPEWKIIPPTIDLVPASSVTITYGEETALRLTTNATFPVKYTLKKGTDNTPIYTYRTTVGGISDWWCGMLNKVPADSGVYVITVTAEPDPSITSLGVSDPVVQEYEFTVRKKELRLRWTLPGGEFTNAEQNVELSFEAEDKVGDDVILVSKDIASVKNAGTYRVTASMDQASQEKYVFPSEGETSASRIFTVAKKSLVVVWDGDTYEYNGETHTPKATTTVFGQTETLLVSGGKTHAGNYTAIATAKEVGANDNGVDIDTDNYRISENETRNYTITKKTAMITLWSESSFLYDGTAHTVSVKELTGYIGGEREIALSDLVYTDNVKTNASDYTVTVFFREASDYTFGEGEAYLCSKPFHIEPKEIGYDWGQTTFDYNKSQQCPVATAKEEDLCGGDRCYFLYDGAEINAGNYVARLIGVTNPNYKLTAEEHETAFTINKITRAALSVRYEDRVYGDEPPTPTVNNNEESGEETFAFRPVGDGAFTTAVPTKAGAYEIRVTTAESLNYFETIKVSGFWITPRPVAISWGEIDPVYSKSAKVPQATITNRVGTDVVHVTSGLTFGHDNVNVGAFTFTVTAVDNADYTITGGSGIVSREYEITPCEITLDWEEPSADALVYSGAAKTVGATAVGLYDGDNCAVTTALTPGKDNVHVGTFTFTATSIDNGNYKLTSRVSGEYAITQKPLNVTVKDVMITYGGRKPYFEYETDALVEGDRLTGNASYATLYDTSDAAHRAVGDYEVSITGLSNPDYALTYHVGTLHVKKRAVNMTWTTDSYVYDGANHLPTASVNNKPYASDEVTAVYDSDVERKNVGQYTRAVTDLAGAESANYTCLEGENLEENWQIVKKSITITVVNKSMVYGEELPDFELDTHEVLTGDEIGSPVFHTTYDLAEPSTRKVGSYVITASGVANANYTIAITDGTLIVNKRTVVISWDKDSYVYDKEGHLPAASVLNKQFGGDEITLRYDTSVERISAGAYVRRVTGIANVGQGENYTTTGSENLTLNWTITQKSASVRVQDEEIHYGDAIPAFAIEMTGFLSGDGLSGKATYVTTYRPGSAIGAYAVSVTGLSNANYDLTFDEGILLVSEREVSVKVNDSVVTYGAAAPAFSVDTSALLFTDTLTGTAAYVATYDQNDPAHNGVGEYEVTVTGLSNANYKIIFLPGTLTVNPKAVSVTVNDKTITYGEEKPSFTLSYTLLGEDTLSGTPAFSTDYIPLDPSFGRAGNHTVSVSGISNPNYALTFVPGTLIVLKKATTVSVNNASCTYGENAPAFALSYYLLGSDTLTGTPNYVTTYRAGSAVGEYAVSVTGVNNQNYEITFLPGTLTVKQKSVTVKVNDSVVTYGSAASAFSVNTSELLFADALTGTAAYVTTYDQNDPAHNGVGNYEVTVTGLSNANYDITFLPGTLTVTRASRAPVAVSIEDWEEGDTPSVPVVTTPIEEEGETTVTFVYGVEGNDSPDMNSCPTEAGTYYVVARLSASTDYLAAESEPCAFTINVV